MEGFPLKIEPGKHSRSIENMWILINELFAMTENDIFFTIIIKEIDLDFINGVINW